MRDERGFSLVELLVAMLIMLIISGAATAALLKMTSTQATIWNRTQMHSGIRGATEVLQQEVGQAGRIALPATATLGGAVTVINSPTTVAITSASGTGGMFPNEYLTIDAGANQETVARRSTVGMPISASIGPMSLMRSDHSPDAGASANLTISTSAKMLVKTNASSV